MAYIAIDEFGIAHYGIMGMRWGVRRFQNEDGSLTPAGRKRYGVKSDGTFQTTLGEARYNRERAKDVYKRTGKGQSEFHDARTQYEYEKAKDKYAKIKGTLKTASQWQERARSFGVYNSSYNKAHKDLKDVSLEIDSLYERDPYLRKSADRARAKQLWTEIAKREFSLMEEMLGKYPGTDKEKQAFIERITNYRDEDYELY